MLTCWKHIALCSAAIKQPSWPFETSDMLWEISVYEKYVVQSTGKPLHAENGLSGFLTSYLLLKLMFLAFIHNYCINNFSSRVSFLGKIFLCCVSHILF